MLIMIILLAVLTIMIYLYLEKVERDIEGLEDHLGVTKEDIPRHTKYNKEK